MKKNLGGLRNRYYQATLDYLGQILAEKNGHSQFAREALAYFSGSVGLPVLQGEEPPDRLVTVQEAVELTGLPYGTVTRWLSIGRLQERGRLWLADPKGRSSPLVSATEVMYLNVHRPSTGRPPKKR